MLLIDFCKLNARTKKDSYLLPHIQEAIENLVGAGYFSCLDLNAVFLADCHVGSFKAIHHLHHRKSRDFLNANMDAIWTVQCPQLCFKV